MKELLAPAGNMECLIAAINNGADAIYIGGSLFGARAYAGNFSNDEIIEAINLCHMYGVKLYVTVNTLINESELLDAYNYVKFLYENNIDAVIMQDIGLINMVHNSMPNLEIHASTQMHNTSQKQIEFLENLGVSRVVMARELSLKEINNINTSLEIEAFIHGALCICYSGECLFSSLVMNRSGNKGKCAQLCRLPYELYENDRKVKTDGSYLLSTKELNTSKYIKDILDSNIYSLKIEGRMKSPEYVGCVTRLYRDLLDKYYNNEEITINSDYLEDLKVIFNRDYTKGFLLNENNNNLTNTSSPNHQGVFLGNIIDYSNKYIKVKLERNLYQEDGIRINEINKGMICNFIYDEKLNLINSAKKGDTIYLDNKFNINSKCTINLTYSKKIKEKYTEEVYKKIPINISFNASIGNMTLKINDKINEVMLSSTSVETAKNVCITIDTVKKQLSKLGETIYEIDNIDINLDNNLFINIKDLNELRRNAIFLLNEKRTKKNYDPEYINFNSIYVYNSDKKINISVTVENEEQLKEVLKHNVDRIYVKNINLYKKYENKNTYLITSRYNESDENITNKLVTSTCNLPNSKDKSIGDYYLNITNHETINYLSKYLDKLTLSIELSNDEIKNIMKNYSKDNNIELVIYSHPEVMILKYNLLDKYVSINNSNKYYLKDRNNENYIIKYYDDITHIYYHSSIDKLDYINDYKYMNINNYRLEFLNESPKEINEIIKKVQELLK